RPAVQRDHALSIEERQGLARVEIQPVEAIAAQLVVGELRVLRAIFPALRRVAWAVAPAQLNKATPREVLCLPPAAGRPLRRVLAVARDIFRCRARTHVDRLESAERAKREPLYRAKRGTDLGFGFLQPIVASSGSLRGASRPVIGHLRVIEMIRGKV